jgi:hypothetical protein
MILDTDNKQVDYDTIESALPKGSQVGCLIQCTGVWFAGSKYGLSWKVTKVRLESVPKSAGNFNFVEDADELDDAPRAVPVSKVVKAVMEEDDDDEDAEEAEKEESEESEEEVVQPVAPPAKKVVAAPVKKVVAAAAPVKKVVKK